MVAWFYCIQIDKKELVQVFKHFTHVLLKLLQPNLHTDSQNANKCNCNFPKTNKPNCT